jgi:hypothetical protein
MHGLANRILVMHVPLSLPLTSLERQTVIMTSKVFHSQGIRPLMARIYIVQLTFFPGSC